MQIKARFTPLVALRLFSAVLLLAMAFAALPQGAQAAPAAASTCAQTHTVKEGESIQSIGKQYGIKWQAIAQANKLTSPYKLEAGDKLCIPYTSTIAPSGKKFTLSVSIRNMWMTLDGKNLPDGTYTVKVSEYASGPWTKIATVNVRADNTLKDKIYLPDELKGVLLVHVCLKNQSTDQSICRQAFSQ